MIFKKKNVDESLTKIELCGEVKVTAEGNNVGNCPTNNSAAGCSCY